MIQKQKSQNYKDSSSDKRVCLLELKLDGIQPFTYCIFQP